MITNGLYSISTKLLDGIAGGETGIAVLRDRKLLAGGPVLYHVGTYQCSAGKWKGEITSQEHTPTTAARPFAGYVATMGFSGTYSDVGAELEATALVGKRSIKDDISTFVGRLNCRARRRCGSDDASRHS